MVRLLAQVQPNLVLAALAEQAQDFPDAEGHRECAKVCEEAAAEIERLQGEVAMYEQLLNDESTAFRLMKESQAERDALRDDAERYRWLHGKRLDAAIDAARGKR